MLTAIMASTETPVPTETPDKAAAMDRMDQTVRAPGTSTDRTVIQAVTQQVAELAVMAAMVLTAKRVEVSHSTRSLACRTTSVLTAAAAAMEALEALAARVATEAPGAAAAMVLRAHHAQLVVPTP